MEILTKLVKWIPRSILTRYKYSGELMQNKDHKMSPSRPYLLKAMLSWILDNNLTPLLIVNIKNKNIEAPLEYFDLGSDAIFDISEQACYELMLEDNFVSFYAQFGEDSDDYKIFLPMKCILGIYAEENGKGMRFTDDDYSGIEEIKSKDTKLPPYLEIVE